MWSWFIWPFVYFLWGYIKTFRKAKFQVPKFINEGCFTLSKEWKLDFGRLANDSLNGSSQRCSQKTCRACWKTHWTQSESIFFFKITFSLFQRKSFDILNIFQIFRNKWYKYIVMGRPTVLYYLWQVWAPI